MLAIQLGAEINSVISTEHQRRPRGGPRWSARRRESLMFVAFDLSWLDDDFVMHETFNRRWAPLVVLDR